MVWNHSMKTIESSSGSSFPVLPGSLVLNWEFFWFFISVFFFFPVLQSLSGNSSISSLLCFLSSWGDQKRRGVYSRLRMPACTTTSERERERATIWHAICKLFIHKFNILAVFTSPTHSTSIFTRCHVPEWVRSPHRGQTGLKCAVDYYSTFDLCSWRQVIKTHMNFGDSSY